MSEKRQGIEMTTALSNAKVVNALVNIVAGLGNTKDKAAYSQYNRIILTEENLRTMYKVSWIIRKVVDVVAVEMVKNWRTVSTKSLDASSLESFKEFEKEVQVKKKLKTAIKWSRLYGGSAIMPILKNAGEIGEELRPEMITKGSLLGFQVFDKTEVFPIGVFEQNPESPNFRKPAFFHLRNGSKPIHHSRLYRFEGLEVPYDEYVANGYWGDSVIESIYNTVLQSDVVQSAAHSLVFEAKVDAVSIKGLKALLGKRKGTQLLMERFALANKLKSLNNMFLLDEGEVLQRHTYSFAGLSDLIDRFLRIVSSSSDIPVTRFLGESASGLSATGEHDEMNFQSKISEEQEDSLEPAINWIDMIMIRSFFGKEVVNWTSKFNTLGIETKEQEANRKKVEAETRQIYVDMRAILPSSVTAKLAESGDYPDIDENYVEAVKQVEQEAADNNWDEDGTV